jgi:hypothetical protein
MKSLNKKYILIALAIIILLIFGVFQLFSRGQGGKTDKTNQNYVKVWDAETASFIKYNSYDEMEEELDKESKERIEIYNKAIKGTIVEQVQNAYIPSYFNEPLAQLRGGEVEVREPASDEFPNGIFGFGAYLEKEINSFVVGDFNNDGLDDVAHIIGYTGGGSGFFYNLSIFINNQGKLKYLTKEELGDRVVVKSVKYNAGEFVIDMITQGEGDDFRGYCCPNVSKTIRFQLKDNLLVEI